ncbi:hypothetical protein F5Y00DRAFT_83621 [Daldinia vernicosa]|uniref:uncharacterized protein n=1 Tax=Daldinia vernicosa TaxID=114800 RepID=UPI0020085BE3|nr:uncharacterized protein F5Y00DRAFT_83621 [Daldinia vernicosa]KAI0848626.1 hypothetical protein F5Y00DRAFT_83621 [Daldinia vernicosa]
MDTLPMSFSGDVRNDQYSASEFHDSQFMMEQGDEYLYAQLSTELSSSSIDALPAKARQSKSSPQKSAPNKRASGRLADRRAKDRSTSQSKSDKADSSGSGSSIRSSETSETRSSHQTVTPPDDTSACTTGRANSKPRQNRVVPPNSPPTTETRQRTHYADDDTDRSNNMSERTKYLQRNRTAATKCRQKKKEWVTELEEMKVDLENQHNHLQKEFNDLKNEVTLVKSQLMDHSGCNDSNINKWIENEAKKFVLGTSEKYDQMLAHLGHSPRHIISRQDSFSSTAGYQTAHDAEIISPVTPSHPFQSGGFLPSPSILYGSDLTPNFPQVAASDSHEEPYPMDALHDTMAEDITAFHNMPMTEPFENPIILTN